MYYLKEQGPLDKARPGDIIRWTTPAHKGGKLWKIVQNWCATEPRQFLVTDLDAADGKCFIVLADDCELVETRDLPQPSYGNRKREEAKELPKHQLPREEPV